MLAHQEHTWSPWGDAAKRGWTQLPNEYWERAAKVGMSHAESKVFLGIMMHSRPSGHHIFCSITRLAKRTGCTRATVCRAIKELGLKYSLRVVARGSSVSGDASTYDVTGTLGLLWSFEVSK